MCRKFFEIKSDNKNSQYLLVYLLVFQKKYILILEIAETVPSETSQNIAPALEDYYLYVFHESTAGL